LNLRSAKPEERGLLKKFNLKRGNVQWLLAQIGYDLFDLALKDKVDKALNEIFYESK
jgi:hypothetical protein